MPKTRQTANLSQEQAFLADILAHPDDDTPRLVFADWLTERDQPGDAERAEFIRVQCQLAALDSVRPLITLPTQLDRFVSIYELIQRGRGLLSQVRDCCHEEWCSWAEAVGQLPLWWHAWEFRRGFVECITLKAADWCRYAERLLATQPIREVTLTTRLEVQLTPALAQPGRVRLHVAGDPEPFRTVKTTDWLVPVYHLGLASAACHWLERAQRLWPGIVFHGPDFRVNQG